LSSSNALPDAVLPCGLAAVIAAGLAVDQRWQPWGQATVDVLVWCLFAGLVFARRGSERVTLLACLAYAAAGEFVLSELLQLYQYRDGSIPLFVPPGHALLLLLGAAVAQQLGERRLRFVPWACFPLVGVAALTGLDPSAPWLFALYVLCVRFGPNPGLYSVMFVLSLMMELYGVWLGNWAWTGEAVFGGPRVYNPPLAAGAFYCVLDWMVMATRERLYPSPSPSPHSQAAPRTPLESPCAGGEIRVSTRSENT
jgi:hypothetical protein